MVGQGLGQYYEHSLIHQEESAPLPYVRESDVVWEYTIWRTIDLREKFNQFFYFPTEKKGSDGRLNFAYVIWNALVANELPIYADDEFKERLDNDDFVFRYTKADTLILEIIDDDENYEYKTVLVPKEFLSEEVLQIRLKEAWYIDKQTTEQYVRILGFCLTKEMYKEHDGDVDYLGTAVLFWVPMQSPMTQRLLSRKEAYFEDNIAHLPTWNYIFRSRMFDSFITRESNRFNRTISDYLTGTDAILESERIECKLLDISLDMWEY